MIRYDTTNLRQITFQMEGKPERLTREALLLIKKVYFGMSEGNRQGFKTLVQQLIGDDGSTIWNDDAAVMTAEEWERLSEEWGDE